MTDQTASAPFIPGPPSGHGFAVLVGDADGDGSADVAIHLVRKGVLQVAALTVAVNAPNLLASLFGSLGLSKLGNVYGTLARELFGSRNNLRAAIEQLADAMPDVASAAAVNLASSMFPGQTFTTTDAAVATHAADAPRPTTAPPDVIAKAARRTRSRR